MFPMSCRRAGGVTRGREDADPTPLGGGDDKRGHVL